MDHSGDQEKTSPTAATSEPVRDSPGVPEVGSDGASGESSGDSVPKRIDRRAFLVGAVAVGSLANAGMVLFRNVEKVKETDPSVYLIPPEGWTMQYRPLGRTGLKVSEIGFGGYPTRDASVLQYAVDRGINYFDTAHCYRGGKSEEEFGRGLKGLRDKVVITTKWCPHHSGKPFKKSVYLEQLDDSLRRLQTDYVDILLNHECSKEDDKVGLDRIRDPEMLEAYEVAHKAGKVRFLGCSGHGPDLMEIMDEVIESGHFDVMLCRYSFLDYPAQNTLIEKAHAHGIGFVAMKTLAGAKGADLARFRNGHTSFKQAALKWVLSNPSVSNLIISIGDRETIDEYVLASGVKMTSADHELLRDYEQAFSAEVCRYCGACQQSCPHDVRIADILRFAMYHNDYKQENRGIEAYAHLVSAERAAHCLHCAGHCEKSCGYDLPIQTLLLSAHQALNDKPFQVEDGPAAGRG